jgi:hypothetical protein
VQLDIYGEPDTGEALVAVVEQVGAVVSETLVSPFTKPL